MMFSALYLSYSETLFATCADLGPNRTHTSGKQN